MENYENLGTIGEGTYGVVIKARHKETGQIVAIKKFKESDEDEQVRKTALREVRILKQLKHDNIVNLIEVFRRKGKLHLVFEFVERTILEDLERNPDGIEPLDVKKCIYQLLKSIEYCHSHNVIHRDIKPENLLISKNGALKLCDFGFARTLAGPGAKYTDYVATRWYRGPELLTGDTQYGKAVDVWAIGCMFAEVSCGAPLFPGESDIDQLFHIIKCFGKLPPRLMEIFLQNPLFIGIKIPEVTTLESLEKRFPNYPKEAVDFMKACLAYEPDHRDSCGQLLHHPYLCKDGFADWFDEELRLIIAKDSQEFKMKQKKTRKSATRERGSTEGRGDRGHGGESLEDQENQFPMKGEEKSKKHSKKEMQPDPMTIQRNRMASRGSEADGSIVSEPPEDGDDGHHRSGLPNLRPTTPRAARLVAFPQLASEQDQTWQNHRRNESVPQMPPMRSEMPGYGVGIGGLSNSGINHSAFPSFSQSPSQYSYEPPGSSHGSSSMHPPHSSGHSHSHSSNHNHHNYNQPSGYSSNAYGSHHNSHTSHKSKSRGGQGQSSNFALESGVVGGHGFVGGHKTKSKGKSSSHQYGQSGPKGYGQSGPPKTPGDRDTFQFDQPPPRTPQDSFAFPGQHHSQPPGSSYGSKLHSSYSYAGQFSKYGKRY